jgi:hypothetical protein
MSRISRFNKAIDLAQEYLRRRNRQGVLISATGWTELAIAQVCRALAIANAMQDSRRRALCLRVLNWLRIDIARIRPIAKAA